MFSSSLLQIKISVQLRLESFIISPNEVFGDIMVLALPPPRPPIDPDDANTLDSINIQPISFKFYMRVDTPLLCY